MPRSCIRVTISTKTYNFPFRTKLKRNSAEIIYRVKLQNCYALLNIVLLRNFSCATIFLPLLFHFLSYQQSEEHRAAVFAYSIFYLLLSFCTLAHNSRELCSEILIKASNWSEHLIFFTCGCSPGLRTGSLQWINFWLFTFSKNYKSSDRAGYIKQKVWKNDKSCGNQYLENFLLDSDGYIKQKVWKTQLEILAISWNLKMTSFKTKKVR